MRANAVESLWGSRDSASVALFAAAVATRIIASPPTPTSVSTWLETQPAGLESSAWPPAPIHFGAPPLHGRSA